MKEGGVGKEKKKKTFSSSLSSLKFMQRARGKVSSSKAGTEGGQRGTANVAAETSEGSGGAKWTSSGASGGRGCSITYEADPLPTGTTTGRLSFGKKKVKENVEAGDGDGAAVNPTYEDIDKPTPAANQQRGTTDGAKKNKRRFIKPNGRDVKRFKKTKSRREGQ
jgi:hypothetical protein